MFKSYLLLTLRRMGKNKLFTGINLSGLALGLAVFLLILEYVAFEWSYNSMYSRSGQVFRVFFSDNGEDFYDYLPPAFGPEVLEQLPALVGMTRYCPYLGNGVFSVADSSKQVPVRAFREEGAVFVDGDFLKFFDRPLLRGSGDLSQPLTLALSESTAKRYFGDADPLGRQVRVNNQFGDLNYTVVGVFGDMPVNSDLQADILFSIQTLASAENRAGNDWANLASWNNAFLITFLELDTPFRSREVEGQLHDLIAQFVLDGDIRVRLQAVSAMHLGTGKDDGLDTYGNRTFVLFLLIAAVLILAIAWINYVNLSTAQALQRAKEISIRKVAGARRGQLIRQHLMETFLFVAISFCLSLFLVEASQGTFNRITGLDLSLDVLDRQLFWAGGLLLIVLTTLVAGAYVAFSLIRFQPVETLRGAFTRSARGVRLRQALVVSQFSISIAFIAATFILFRQLQFLSNRDLGLNLDQRLAVKGPDLAGEAFNKRVTRFRNQLSQFPFVGNYSSSGSIPGVGYNFTADHITGPNPQPGDEDLGYRMLMIDDRYLTTYEIGLVAGQNFTPQHADQGWDSDKVLINEAALQALGFSSAMLAVGKQINWQGNLSREVIGVVRDYNHESLHVAVPPTIFLPALNSNYFSMALTGGDFNQNIRKIEDLYQEAFPGNPFDYFFVEEEFDRYYLAEKRMGWLFSAASLLAILLSCLGLFGLAVYTAEQRTKEVGIRKILGASVADILALLSGSFLRPVLLAMLIATPIAWYGMSHWLENFAYRVDVVWWIFFAAGATALLIAFLIVSVQSYRVAAANPVDSLRNE